MPDKSTPTRMADPLPELATETKPGSWSVYPIAAGVLVAALAIVPLDSRLSDPRMVSELPGDLKKFISLSELFAHGFGVLLIALVICLLVPGKRRFLPRIAVCAFWPALIVHGIKLLFGRMRPIHYFDEFSIAHFPADQSQTWLGWLPYGQFNTTYATQSFPSAHAATAWGLAIGMSYVFPKGKWLFLSIAVLGSLQRVTAFAHWPSDVLLGAAIAICFGGATTQNWGVGAWLGRFERRRAADGSMTESSAQCKADAAGAPNQRVA